MSKVTIYSTPTCSFCNMAKNYFDEKNVPYEDYNVAEDRTKAEEMVQKSGQMGVPFIVIEKDGKEEYVLGFDQPKLAELLEIN